MDTLNDVISALKWGNLEPIEAHDRIEEIFKQRLESVSDVETLVMRWKNIDLGTKFRYIGTDKIWVKLERNLIAEYNEKFMFTDARWMRQSFSAFADSEAEIESLKVEVIK